MLCRTETAYFIIFFCPIENLSRQVVAQRLLWSEDKILYKDEIIFSARVLTCIPCIEVFPKAEPHQKFRDQYDIVLRL